MSGRQVELRLGPVPEHQSMLKSLIVLLPMLVPLTALSGDDPVADCRDRHADDAEARIACLEMALDALRDRPASRPEDAAREPAVEDVAVGMGAEQVEAARRADDDGDASTDVRIVAATYDARGLGTFRMADGQVWRETTASSQRRQLEPGREYEARIVRSIMGGYRMHVDGVRHMKTVRRVE
jgi:hypothetical protein